MHTVDLHLLDMFIKLRKTDKMYDTIYHTTVIFGSSTDRKKLLFFYFYKILTPIFGEAASHKSTFYLFLVHFNQEDMKVGFSTGADEKGFDWFTGLLDSVSFFDCIHSCK